MSRRGSPLSCLVTLAVASILGAAGCADRPLVLVGRSTLRDGLVGLWHFDEETGPIAADSSGNDNHGMLPRLADLSTVWVPGKFGNALAVEAANYAVVPLTASIDGIASGVSMSAWVYLEGPIMDFGTAISRQIGTGLDQYFHLSVHAPEGTASLFISPTAPSQALAGPKVPPNTWVHLAGTYDEGAATDVLYVNGEAVVTKPLTGPTRFATDTTPVILGGNTNGSAVTEVFPGRLDEIALYDRALSPLEIAQLARAPVF